MAVSLAARVSVPPDVLISKVGDESVILDLDSERYFGLDAVGTHMWTILTTSDTVQAAYEQLLGEYEVDAEVLRQDLLNLVGMLRERGLVEVYVE